MDNIIHSCSSQLQIGSIHYEVDEGTWYISGYDKIKFCPHCGDHLTIYATENFAHTSSLKYPNEDVWLTINGVKLQRISSIEVK